MMITIDTETRCTYALIRLATHGRTLVYSPDVHIDFDEDGAIYGLEFLTPLRSIDYDTLMELVLDYPQLLPVLDAIEGYV